MSEETGSTKNPCQHRFNYVSDEDAKTNMLRYCMYCGFSIRLGSAVDLSPKGEKEESE